MFFSDVGTYLPNCQRFVSEDRKLYMVRCCYIFCVVYVAIGDCSGSATNRKVAGSIPDGVIGIFHFS